MEESVVENNSGSGIFTEKVTPVTSDTPDTPDTPDTTNDDSTDTILIAMPISSIDDKSVKFSKTNIMFVIIIILLIVILFIYMNDIPKLPNIFLY